MTKIEEWTNEWNGTRNFDEHDYFDKSWFIINEPKEINESHEFFFYRESLLYEEIINEK
jgi:hypothetical protein